MRFTKRRGENERAEDRGHATKEFWSRRPYLGEGKDGKRLTHRAERRAAKRELARALDYASRWGNLRVPNHSHHWNKGWSLTGTSIESTVEPHLHTIFVQLDCAATASSVARSAEAAYYSWPVEARFAPHCHLLSELKPMKGHSHTDSGHAHDE
jgi:hypothetical protein